MNRNRAAPVLVVVLNLVLAASALAAEATGKVVWVDHKNSSLLLECPDKGCLTIPGAKPGETYSFAFPATLKTQMAGLKEGETIKIVYDENKDQGYVITAVSK